MPQYKLLTKKDKNENEFNKGRYVAPRFKQNNTSSRPQQNQRPKPKSKQNFQNYKQTEFKPQQDHKQQNFRPTKPQPDWISNLTTTAENDSKLSLDQVKKASQQRAMMRANVDGNSNNLPETDKMKAARELRERRSGKGNRKKKSKATHEVAPVIDNRGNMRNVNQNKQNYGRGKTFSGNGGQYQPKPYHPKEPYQPKEQYQSETQYFNNSIYQNHQKSPWSSESDQHKNIAAKLAWNSEQQNEDEKWKTNYYNQNSQNNSNKSFFKPVNMLDSQNNINPSWLASKSDYGFEKQYNYQDDKYYKPVAQKNYSFDNQINDEKSKYLSSIDKISSRLEKQVNSEIFHQQEKNWSEVKSPSQYSKYSNVNENSKILLNLNGFANKNEEPVLVNPLAKQEMLNKQAKLAGYKKKVERLSNLALEELNISKNSKNQSNDSLEEKNLDNILNKTGKSPGSGSNFSKSPTGNKPRKQKVDENVGIKQLSSLKSSDIDKIQNFTPRLQQKNKNEIPKTDGYNNNMTKQNFNENFYQRQKFRTNPYNENYNNFGAYDKSNNFGTYNFDMMIPKNNRFEPNINSFENVNTQNVPSFRTTLNASAPVFNSSNKSKSPFDPRIDQNLNQGWSNRIRMEASPMETDKF